MERRLEQAIDAAKLYYGRGVSQEDVARTLGVSRPTVSKLIQLAKERGFVTVSIHDPRESTSDLGEQVRERFGLEAVRLAVGSDDPRAPYDQLGGVGAQLVQELVRPGDRVGLAWGHAVHAVGRFLVPRPLDGVEVVELQGGTPGHGRSTYQHETMSLFCDAFDAVPRSLHLPVFFDDPRAWGLVRAERHVAEVLALGESVDLAVLSVHPVDEDSPVVRLGYVRGDDRARLLERASADVCSRFVDAAGLPCLPDLDARTASVTLEGLRRAPRRVCVAGGRRRARALHAALQAGCVTHLVTDVAAAEALVDLP